MQQIVSIVSVLWELGKSFLKAGVHVIDELELNFILGRMNSISVSGEKVGMKHEPVGR